MTVVESLSIEGAHLVGTCAHPDERGWFERLFDARFFEELGCAEPLRQVNLSRTNSRGCARGLHMQRQPRCGFKLVICLRGSIWDVCLDARPDSKTFGRWEGRTLDESRPEFLLLPPGCAHGFQSLTDDAEVLYLMSEDHDPASEVRIQMQDPDLSIAWPLPFAQVSPADASARGLSSTFSRTKP